jgi:hypothetical protein
VYHMEQVIGPGRKVGHQFDSLGIHTYIRADHAVDLP